MTMIAFSPLRISVLLHYYAIGGPIQNRESLATVEAIEDFLKMGVLERDEENEFRTTGHGKAWVAALCNVPLPKAVFIDEQGRVLK